MSPHLRIYRSLSDIKSAFVTHKYLLLIRNSEDLYSEVFDYELVIMISRFIINDARSEGFTLDQTDKHPIISLYDNKEQIRYISQVDQVIGLLLKHGYVAISATGLGHYDRTPTKTKKIVAELNRKLR